MSLQKVIIITGASSRIGESSAKLLAQNGAKVVLGARRKERLESFFLRQQQENLAVLRKKR